MTEAELILARPKIAVFDSGVGGLTVLRAMLKRMPSADYLYFGDTARLPYGSKSVETVARFAVSAAKFLESKGADYLVVACNTATALAFDAIRDSVRMPTLGVIEPGAQQAATVTLNKKVIVIATEGTVKSGAYTRALAAHGVKSEEKACPLFVPLVEEGWLDHPVTEQVAHIYLDPLFAENGADAIVLGCTHYPLLKPLLRRVVPEKVVIVDSAEATAGIQVLNLKPEHAGATAPGSPALRFFATDSVEKFKGAGEKFLGLQLANVEHVDIEGA